MKRYETVFILRPDLGEAQIEEAVKRFEGIVGAGGGNILEADRWGLRDLAYQIRGERRGYYVRLDYASQPSVMNELERNLKLQDTVLRYLSVLVAPEVDVSHALQEIEARRRRSAEAKSAAEARAAAAAAQREAASEPETTEGEGEGAAEGDSEPERGGDQ